MKIQIKHVVGIIVIMLVILSIFSFGTIKAGYRGVLTQFGAVTGKIIQPGFYVHIPFVQHVTKMNVQVQKEQVSAGSASQDLQTVDTVIALNYHMSPDSVGTIYQNIGIDYKSRVLDPSIQESVKAATAKFTAEQLITNREAARQLIEQLITTQLEEYGIHVDQVSIVNFDFSESFNDAIENKVTTEQNALAAKNKLQQVQYEAQQRVEAAKGEAQSIQIEGNALRSNPEILQLRGIEKWNDYLPTVTSGVIPFINVGL